MDAYPVSQQTDEGYSEDPLNPPPDTSNFAFQTKDDISALSELRATSPAQFTGWLSDNLSALSVHLKTQLALELLDNLPTSVIAEIVQKMHPRLYIDFIKYLPPEICLKILGYLDPDSLIAVAKTCKAWYILALDRKLWQRLYHLEGWKAFTSEIEAAENKVNANLMRPAPGSMQRLKSEEDGHTYKKRAVSPAEYDQEDSVMTDVDQPLTQEPRDLGPGESSIFGGDSTDASFIRSSMTPDFRALNMGSSGSSWGSAKGKGTDWKGKGKARETSPPTPSFVNAESMPEMLPSEGPGGQVKTTLWMWDASSRQYKINWKYLYTMRRKLESNWEQGNYKNFQLPHPDHPEEGHANECIYSLQYNDEYLVSGSRDRTLRIWKLATRRLARPPLTGHLGSVLCLQFDSDPDEDIIVSGSSDSDVIIWRFSTGEILQRLTRAHRESVLNVKFDRRILVTCSKDKTIKVFNRRQLKPGDPGYRTVNPVPINVRRYGYEQSPLDQLPVLPPYTIIGVLDGHNAAVNAVQIVGNEVVSASGDRQIKVWDWPTGVCKRTYVGHAKGIACVQYDGKRIVSGSSDNEVKVFCRETGVEVASLKAHTELVRTVQSGFGDLPWSTEEDQAEAKRVDQEYFKALEAGSLPSTPQRGRPGNAGSRRPEDITAYGAKLPPGGGGGKYGRIVSGSYDNSIIIWRRDKNGAWKARHHLTQEAATANARQAAQAAEAARMAEANAVLPLHPSVRPPDAPAHAGNPLSAGAGHSTTAGAAAPGSAAAGPSMAPPPPGPSGSHRGLLSPGQPVLPDTPTPVPVDQITLTQVTSPVLATLTPSSQHSLAHLIDLIVPQGVPALQRALANYPSMLALQSTLQAAIDRVGNPLIRSQLRQAVSTAMVRTQIAQARARQQGFQALMSSFNSNNGEASGSGSNSEPQAGPSSQAQPSQQTATASASAATPATASASTNTVTAHANVAVAGPPPPPPQPTAPVIANGTHPPAQPPAAAAAGGGHHHHPHLAAGHGGGGEFGLPTRVYKLQFDARSIICCSQTSVIVGWDFCNGDPELEEASRFFATVD